ncbi:MAG: hypothetical protein AB7O73_08675 [Bacteroidia bacterium]
MSNLLDAQYNTEFLDYSRIGRSISINLDYEAGSNAIKNDMVNTLIWGGHISNEMKDASEKKLRNENNFGIYLNYGVAGFIKGKENYDFLVGFKNQEVLNASFNADFYRLMFYGNKRFAGGTADISRISVNALRFQEAKFGFIIHHLDSVAKIGASVSFLKGEQLFDFKTGSNTYLYTSPDATNITFNSQFNLAISDTNNKNLLSFNGIGANADLFFDTPYNSKIGKKSVLLVNANNIGFIHWRNNSVQYESDSIVSFNGYRIENILDLKDSTLQKINQDTILQNLINSRRENFNINIPTNLVLINRIYFGKMNFVLNTGFRYIFNANYKPYVFAEPEYILNKKWIFNLHVGYGGYVRLNMGTSVCYIGKHLYFKLGSNSLQGYIAPKIAYGQGLYFSIAKKFK